MKTKNFRLATKLLLCALFVVSLNSCCKDDDDEITTVSDNVAGSFKLLNPASGEELVATFYNCIKIYVGDTIKVDFTPNDKYKNCKFNINCEQLKKVGENLFVVPEALKSAEAHKQFYVIVGEPGEPVKFTASYNEVKEDVKYILSAEVETRLFAYGIPENLLVKYTLDISQDLAQFVIPTITFPNENGNGMNSLVVKDTDWIKSNVEHVKIYSDVNGKHHHIIEGEGKQPESGWELLEEYDYLPPYYYTLDRNYTTKNTTLTVTVSYQQKENINITEDSYEFNHKLDWNNEQRGLVINLDLTDHTVKKEKVQEYLDNLVGKTDEVKLYIDRTGKIEQIYK